MILYALTCNFSGHFLQNCKVELYCLATCVRYGNLQIAFLQLHIIMLAAEYTVATGESAEICGCRNVAHLWCRTAFNQLIFLVD